MLKVILKGEESFDESSNRFVGLDDYVLELEHSLVSVSKWESKWEKPFLTPEPKTTEETFGYIEAMTLNPDVTPELYSRLSNENMTAINEYLSAKMSATWFAEGPKTKSREIITSELIYYWMISMNIPIQCEHWHLNRLFTLIKVCNEKNSPKKKMSRSELAAQNRALNEQRRQQLKSSG